MVPRSTRSARWNCRPTNCWSSACPAGAGSATRGSGTRSLVRQDVLNGLVSVEQARDTYCVAFTEDGAVDVALTARLRSVGGGTSASGVDM
jgi:N-methylhydantoinase B/oxoprolinase/acetone carboxylase alpha subunit